MNYDWTANANERPEQTPGLGVSSLAGIVACGRLDFDLRYSL